MPIFNKKKETKPNSKKGLGRGLSSLLPTDTFHFGHSQGNLSFKETQRPSNPLNSLSKEQRQKDFGNPSGLDKFSSKTKKSNDNNSLDNFSRKIIHLPIEELIPNQSQPRKDFLRESLEELALSIKEQGILQPVIVRKREEKFEIIAGERRFKASQMVGLKEIPVILKENVDDQKSMELALIENLQREDLNILEEAMGYQLLMDDFHLSQKELAFKIGKKRSSIANILRILTLPEDVKNMLKQGSLSLGHAKVLLSTDNAKKQSQFARKTLIKNLSVRDLEKEIRKESNKKSQKVQSTQTLNGWIVELERSLQRSLGTKVDIHYRNGKGRISIVFYSDEELSQFYEKFKNL